ncbi:hypothetical protein GCM10010341_07690 [Streptomyces noursei]|nr:hypothetical protein GCM10010341_07690 [Streptomyces noursei]
MVGHLPGETECPAYITRDEPHLPSGILDRTNLEPCTISTLEETRKHFNLYSDLATFLGEK